MVDGMAKAFQILILQQAVNSVQIIIKSPIFQRFLGRWRISFTSFAVISAP